MAQAQGQGRPPANPASITSARMQELLSSRGKMGSVMCCWHT